MKVREGKVLNIEGVYRSYIPGKPILQELSLKVDRGEVIGLLGRNGAGKTTLLRMIMAMIHPQKGTLNVFGLDPWKNHVAVKQRIGYVAEDQTLPVYLKVSELIRAHRVLFPSWDLALEKDLIQRFDIEENKKIGVLSKGQARKVALLCAVAHRPELLVLDEPAGGLDPVVRKEFLETTIHLLSRHGSTILFSSHQMEDVERLSSRIALLHDGKILADSELDDLRQDYSLVVASSRAEVDYQALLSIKGCIRVRKKESELRAVFAMPSDPTCSIVKERTSIRDFTCSSMALEEFFVEALGD